MSSEKSLLLDMLEDALKGELQVITQYMFQHIKWLGITGYSVNKVFRNIAIQEMKHAEMIAEKLIYFERDPSTDHYQIEIGEDLQEMLENNKEAEEKTIDLYKSIIELSQKLREFPTMNMFLKIIEEEEEHHDIFTTILDDDLFKV
jgi:bacterioferritin